MTPSKLWIFFPVLAVLCGSTRLLWLIHDVQKWQSGWFDDLLHALIPFSPSVSLLYLIGILGLFYLLAKAICTRPPRAIWLGLVWCAIGLGLADFAGSYLTQLQDTYNNWLHARLTPDDYLRWVGSGPDRDDYIARVFGPVDAPDYTWENMILRENVWICVMSCVAAVSLYLVRREPVRAAWITPIALVISLYTYGALAPWSMLLAWDEFVGDRILGAVGMSAFLFYWWDASGSAVTYVFVLSMAVFAVTWTYGDRRREVQVATQV